MPVIVKLADETEVSVQRILNLLLDYAGTGDRGTGNRGIDADDDFAKYDRDDLCQYDRDDQCHQGTITRGRSVSPRTISASQGTRAISKND